MGVIFEQFVYVKPTAPFIGESGDREYVFVTPVNEEYDFAELTVSPDSRVIGNANIKEQPVQGQVGTLRVIVHWWFDGHIPLFTGLSYNLKIFSREAHRLGQPGRIFLFEHSNFEGRVKDVINGDKDLTFNDNAFFNDKISSLIITKGNWIFFRDVNFVNPFTFNGNQVVLGPGMYPDVSALDITNDNLSSLLCVEALPNHR